MNSSFFTDYWIVGMGMKMGMSRVGSVDIGLGTSRVGFVDMGIIRVGTEQSWISGHGIGHGHEQIRILSWKWTWA